MDRVQSPKRTHSKSTWESQWEEHLHLASTTYSVKKRAIHMAHTALLSILPQEQLLRASTSVRRNATAPALGDLLATLSSAQKGFSTEEWQKSSNTMRNNIISLVPKSSINSFFYGTQVA